MTCCRNGLLQGIRTMKFNEAYLNSTSGSTKHTGEQWPKKCARKKHDECSSNQGNIIVWTSMRCNDGTHNNKMYKMSTNVEMWQQQAFSSQAKKQAVTCNSSHVCSVMCQVLCSYIKGVMDKILNSFSSVPCYNYVLAQGASYDDGLQNVKLFRSSLQNG